MIKHIVVHCSATKEGEHFTAEDIHRWHKERGWSGIGYHYVVLLDGTIENGRPEYWNGAHVKGFNDDSLGICYIGGLDANGKAKDTRTEGQKEVLYNLLIRLKKKHPAATILGHRDFSEDTNNNGIIESFEFMKECPCYDAKKEYEHI